MYTHLQRKTRLALVYTVALNVFGCTLSLRISEEPAGDALEVSVATRAIEVFQGLAVTLSASAIGGTEPLFLRWDQNAGPAALTLADVTSETLVTELLETPGRYVFRVLVTDREGNSDTAFVVVQVLAPFAADVPELAVVGQPVALIATSAPGAEAATLVWSIVRGSGSIDDPMSSSTELTTVLGETVEVELTTMLDTDAGDVVVGSQRFEIVSIVNLTPRVKIETNFGAFTIELDAENAPGHAVNFLWHVDTGFYEGLLFHRNVCTPGIETDVCDPFVLQGGGFERVDGEIVLVEISRDPVESEADNGLTNGDLYTVSLALTGDANSGTTQFFINLADNSFLDSSGFTVFGSVVEGIDVVDAIAAMARTDSPIVTGEVSLPAEDVIMLRVTRVLP